jgi:NAD(P)-dependent dehydrogenase (short-subunit alcohol dehydrogenase family)
VFPPPYAQSDIDLSGRTAIVTGASQGLGAAVAERFLAAGAAVMLCARNAGDLEQRRRQLAEAYSPDRIAVQAADVARETEVDAVFEAALSRFETIHILVNNAGITGPIGTLDSIDWSEWLRTIAINLGGTAYCSRKAVALFAPQGFGKIINITGGGASDPLPRMSAYAVSKAAIVRFTETLAWEVKGNGIDVNAVAPGPLATRMFGQLIAAGPDRIGPELFDVITKLKASGATPLELGAELCAYLASPKSDGLSGRMIAARWDPWPFTTGIKDEIQNSDIYTLRRITPQDRGRTWGSRP